LRGSDAAAREEACRIGVPLTVLALDDPALAELYEAPYVLVRPDQHVAWRGKAWPSDAWALLNHVTGSGIDAAGPREKYR
jgi:hypothetical protein